ncbi:unnamed protein product [Clonostachys chloroleuca]|uniref:Uncharacterized protein n=1 Tax=Clonostachys chloroleuca TaxID=1926264 RepID=A0AA35LTB4_9HYPO|nr:unnamed protein product [Clonostachys chloroleuca]
MEGFTRNNTDAFHEAAAGCTNISESARSCNGERCQVSEEVYFSRVDAFIKDYENGSMCTRHVQSVRFSAKEEKARGSWAERLAHRMGWKEESAKEDIFAAETQEKIFSALCSVWDVISEWDLDTPLALIIEGRYFWSNDKCQADLAHQKNISKLVCEDATFVDLFDVLKIAKRLPELNMLGVHVQHMDKQLRTNLANEMRTWKTALPKLNDLRLHGEKKRNSYYSRVDDAKLEDMREDGIDMLCRELRLLTQQHRFIGLELNLKLK